MAAPKFLPFSFAISRTTSRVFSPRFSPKRFNPKLIHLIKYSSSTSLETTDASSQSINRIIHPWPEWVSFVDRLKTKGYLIEPSSEDVNEDGNRSVEATVSEDVYRDMNLLKDSFLSFARDRYDIFKSLSMDDIETIVKSGCPNLLRKAVNSAKRLRAYVRLDEGDVCSTCNLRGSCDRAYVILKESEATARTVDVARLLLVYALDPLVLSGGEKPLGRESVEISVRKLLSELAELSDKPHEPAVLKAKIKSPPRREKPPKFTDGALSKDVEMKRGDWMCTKCNFLNFARNKQCFKCNEDGPKRVRADNIEMKNGDWTCSRCNFMNFSRNIRCLECKAEGPKKVTVEDIEIEMKKGDWLCPQCAFMNFASNKKCLRCREHRPKRELNTGEWECPSCDFLNYKGNTSCRKCNGQPPKQRINAEYEDHLWK